MRSGTFLVILMILMFLPGCGRKGPLRLPEHQAHAHVVAPAVSITSIEDRSGSHS